MTDRTENLVTIESVAVGGDGVARAADGRVLFVTGAIPGERVNVTVERSHARHAFARVVDVVDPSPHRVAPPCPEVARGCGGCGWQHVDPMHQTALRRAIVAEALRRVGRFDEAVLSLIRPAVVLPTSGYRNSVRMQVVDGRAAFRRAGTHDNVRVDTCLVAHPLVAEVIEAGRFETAHEVTIRAGIATGDRLVMGEPTLGACSLPDGVRTADARTRGVAIVERVGGHEYRVSSRSFFQSRTDGAEVLVDLVQAVVGTGDTVADLYSGVGLFALPLTECFDHVVAVESSRSSIDDAKHNLRNRNADVVRSAVERWRPRACDAVVADPSRDGLRAAGAAVVVATGARIVALVSCDAASFARDARLLVDGGYELTSVQPIDMFPHTPHVEVVGAFRHA